MISLNHPPVNGLSHPVRQQLAQCLQRAIEDTQVNAIVLIGDGKGFSAGADIAELGTPAAIASPGLSQDIHPLMECSPKPVVAAIHGWAVGGGLETALACHYRLATETAKVGLPEVKVGVIPLSGTQRLPRILGLSSALEVILRGEIVTANDWHSTSVFDQLIAGDREQLLVAAIQFARQHASDRPLPLIRQRSVLCADAQAVLAQADALLDNNNPAAQGALEAIRAGIEADSFDEGMNVARCIYQRLSAARQAGRVRTTNDNKP